jgi:hypothetical protein
VIRLLALVLGALFVAAPAAAQERQVIGVYAPSAPFDGPVARLEFATRLARAVGPTWSGRAFAKAGDLAAAVKRGEIHFAVLDAPYVAAIGVPYQILATSVRSGSTQGSWELVVAAGRRGGLAELKGTVLAVPSVGARDDAFVSQVLLDGELGIDHFGRVVFAPDALSALASVGHGRADAAIVPSGLPLPAGVRRAQALGGVGWPVLVAFPGAPSAAISQVSRAALSYSGDVFERFQAGGTDEVRRLAGRFSGRTRRGPMVTPTLRLSSDALLTGRSFKIERPDVLGYASEPSAPTN